MRNRHDLARDEDGLEFSDLDAAYLEAFRAARDIWQELLVEGEDPQLYAFEIADDAGQVLIDLPFIEVFGSKRGRSARSAMSALAKAKARAERIKGVASAIVREVSAARLTLDESRNILSRARRWDGTSEA